MTLLVPMSESEIARFLAETVPAYAADKVASGQWSPGEAPGLEPTNLNRYKAIGAP